MEVTCEVIKTNTLNNSLDRSLDTFDNQQEIINKFKNLNLSHIVKISNKNDFYEFINKKKIIRETSKLMKIFYQQSDKVAKAALNAYYISGYPDEIFGEEKTFSELKLISYANKIILYIEKYLYELSIDDEFYDMFDIFYASYKLWLSQHTVDIINEKIESLKELIYSYKKTGRNNILKNIFLCIDQIFEENFNIATKMLLENYNYMSYNKLITTYFWKIIHDKFIDNINNKEILILILITELRVQIINNLQTSQDKKNLFYRCDPEDLIKCIRSDSLCPSCLNNYLDILINTTKIINPRINIEQFNNMSNEWSSEYDEYLIKISIQMFNAMYN